MCARFPRNLSGQVPWQKRQAGVYDCQWGTDTIRVIVAGELPPEAHNAPLHLFSASPELIGFGSGAYERRSKNTSGLLGQLFERLQGEGFSMSFTMEDFQRQYIKDHYANLSPEEQRALLESLSPEQQQEVLQSLPTAKRLAGLPAAERLAGLTAEQIQQYLDQLTARRPTERRKQRKHK